MHEDSRIKKSKYKKKVERNSGFFLSCYLLYIVTSFQLGLKQEVFMFTVWVGDHPGISNPNGSSHCHKIYSFTHFLTSKSLSVISSIIILYRERKQQLLPTAGNKSTSEVQNYSCPIPSSLQICYP